MGGFADDPLVSRVVRLLAEDLGKLTPDEQIDFAVAALAIIAADQKWYPLMQLCLPLLNAVPEAMRDDLPDMEDDDLARFLTFGHRISDAIHLKLHGREAVEDRLCRVQRPARRWNLPWTDRWVSTDTVRDLLIGIRDAARAKPPSRRHGWIAKALRKRCTALNARMLDATDFQLIRHSMATGSQWVRLAKISQHESIQIRIHYGSGYLSVALRVGDIAKTKRSILPLWVGQMMSDEERPHIDRHFALSFLSTIVFSIVMMMRERRPVDALLPSLQLLYARLFGDLFVDPEVQREIAALGDHPTLVVAAYGAFAQLPFAALHDGERYLAERFNVVQATPLFRGDFNVGDIDYDAVVGGGPLACRTVRVMAGGEHLHQVEHELDDLKRLASECGFDLAIGPVDGGRWTDVSLRWLLEGSGIALLSAHMRASVSNAAEAVVITPDGRQLAVGDALSSPIDAGLVVLAGCHSSGSTDWLAPNEDSVVSLMRSAGADAVVSTLWPVEDYCARLYNVALIEALVAGLSRASAHGAAQRAIMQSSATVGQMHAAERLAWRDGQSVGPGIRDSLLPLDHPGFWAGFILTGAWR